MKTQLHFHRSKHENEAYCAAQRALKHTDYNAVKSGKLRHILRVSKSRRLSIGKMHPDKMRLDCESGMLWRPWRKRGIGVGLFFSHQPLLAQKLRRVSRVSATSPRYTSIYLLPLVYEVGWRLLTLLNPHYFGFRQIKERSPQRHLPKCNPRFTSRELN